MTESIKKDSITAAKLLAMDETDTARFLSKCLRDRSLSLVVSDLNKDVLHGSQETSDRARRALHHIGFI